MNPSRALRLGQSCVAARRVDQASSWMPLLAMLVLTTLLLASCLPATRPGEGDDLGRTVIYRDTWGVPHIYAPDVASGCYAMGWSQAEDRPTQLLRNFMRAMGQISRVIGEAGLESDWMALAWDHYGVAQRGLNQVGSAVRPCLSSFVEGANEFYAKHPGDRPEWWGSRPVDEAMVLAFARMFLYSWSIDDGFGDLIRGGVRPGQPQTARASNQFAVASDRTGDGVAMLGIDPHLSWWGPSRFWEFRIHAGELQGSGVTLPGFPTIGLGHNRFLAWAMTTGGPDTADVYRLELSPDDPMRYRYQGQWRPLAARTVQIQVRGEPEPRSLQILSSHQGPVVAREGSTAYALRTAYAEEVGILDAWWLLNMGRDYRDAEAALATLQFFPQNVMVADVGGNIYYQRTGRVPRRPEGFDWSRPVDGTTAASEWLGFHPAQDLVQLLNPGAGYMQNCNIPPDMMLRNSPLTPDRYPDYIYSDRGHGPLGGWSNPRGARAVELLEPNHDVSPAEAMDLLLDIQPYGVQRWLEALKLALDHSPRQLDIRQRREAEQLVAWDGRLARDSVPALAYYYWRRQLQEDAPPEMLKELRARLDNYRASVGVSSQPVEIDPERARVLLQALAASLKAQASELGGTGHEYGRVFRVGRGDRSWPVGGGGPTRLGLTTLRNVNYGAARPDAQRWGTSGQTATQLVLMERPIRSWSAVPIGQSDRVNSTHFRDQAERVFSPRRLKPTWWNPEQLASNIESRTVLR